MIYQHLNISTNGKQDGLKQPEANTDLLYFSAVTYYKCSVEKKCPYICYRIIVLTCPDNKSVRNQPKPCLPTMQNHTNIISIEIFAPFQFVPVRVKTREYHH